MDVTPYLEALQADKDRNWNKAHEIVQGLHSNEAAWIHAYLHRKEGDCFNADYWYNRAGKPYFEGSPDEEWQQLMEYFETRK